MRVFRRRNRPNQGVDLFASIALGTICTVCVAPSNGAELTVGTKVIYPGANGGSPLEKDTGTSLRVNVHSSGVPSAENPGRQERLQNLLDEGEYEQLLKTTARYEDAVSRCFRAVALERLERPEEARVEAQSVLRTGMVPQDLLEEITHLAEGSQAIASSSSLPQN